MKVDWTVVLVALVIGASGVFICNAPGQVGSREIESCGKICGGRTASVTPGSCVCQGEADGGAR